MKNRGFAITGILYSILVLFLILLALLVFSLQSKKTILDRLKSNTMDEIEGVVKGKSSDNSGVTIDTTDQYSSTGVKQLGLKGVVYLDPTDLSKYCTADNSTIGSGTSGCMKWYIYDDSDNNYKMILDHNTENGVVWNSSGVNVAYASSGAYTSIQNLVTNNNWDSSLNTTIITAAEINAITEKTGFDTTSIASYYFFTNPNKNQTPVANSKGASKYAWLYDYTNDCASYGCNISTSGTGDYGYWTQDPVGTASSGTAVWLVDRNDSLYPIDANHGSRGVRPVITISKSDVNTNLCAYDENHEFTFDYTGGEQEFTIPCSGNYKIETWGAQGAVGKGQTEYTSIGGYGGYSIGTTTQLKNTDLYINVGGQGGTSVSEGTASVAGYNGGSYSGGSGWGYAGSGGATHIALVSGLLSSLDSYKGTLDATGKYYISNKILIVSGGGGSFCPYIQRNSSIDCTKAGNGSNGGGFQGMHGSLGGTQIAGGISTTADGSTLDPDGNGKFGAGTGHHSSGHSSSTGGGGFFGGAGINNQDGSCGGGGSGYIGNSSLTDKKMVCYNCTTSNEVATKTESNTCHNSNPTADCSKEGNGYAKITYLGK